MIEALTDVVNVIAAFAGGALGAAIGPLAAFVLTGVLVIAGETVAFVDPDATAITEDVAFGPPFSPAISFAGGAAATAYAARRGYLNLDTGFQFHEAKNVLVPPGTNPDVLAVGGAFGIVGYWIQMSSEGLGLPWDPIALGVVLSAFLHRLVFGYDLIGTIRGRHVLDMSPFERNERRVVDDRATNDSGSTPGLRSESEARTGSESGTRARSDLVESDRLAVEPWLPHQCRWNHVATLGAVAGVLGAYIALVTESAFLAFGISAASLLFLVCGVDRTPVTHHITLPASTAALAVVPDGDALLAGASPSVALLVGAAVGVAAALFAELFQRVFYAHGDTHVDPPAAGLVFGTAIVAGCYVLGIFPEPVWVPLP